MAVKKVSKKVLSARVSPDVYTAWQSLAKGKNMSVSECLRDAVTVVDKQSILKAQDGMEVPDDLSRVLGAIGGGGVTSILLYKGIRATLEDKSNLSTDEIEAVSFILAMAGGLIVGTGLYKAFK